MKRRAGGLVSLAVCILLAYLIWENLTGGQGLTRNVLRNGLLGALAPWAIYSLVLLFGSSDKQRPVSSGETDNQKGAGNSDVTGAGTPTGDS